MHQRKKKRDYHSTQHHVEMVNVPAQFHQEIWKKTIKIT